MAINPLLLRGAAAFAIAAYTLAALLVNWRNAMPIFVAELLLLAYVATHRLCRRLSSSRARTAESESGGSARGSSTRCPGAPIAGAGGSRSWLGSLGGRARAALCAAAIAAHLFIVLALGAHSLQQWVAVVGLGVLILGCYAASLDRRRVRWRPVLAGFLLQFWLAVACLRTPIGLAGIQWAACQVSALLGHAGRGASFVFGELATSVWAFSVLPVTIFFSSLCAVLLHLGFLQVVFAELGGMLSLVLGVTRAEAIW